MSPSASRSFCRALRAGEVIPGNGMSPPALPQRDMFVLSQIPIVAISPGDLAGDAGALAIVCLIAYALHLFNQCRTRRETRQIRQTLDSAIDRLNTLESGHVLAESETRILRQLAAASSFDESLDCLLNFCIPDVNAGFAVFVALNDDGSPREVWSRGLSPVSSRNIVLDPDWLKRLNDEPAFRLAARETQESQFFQSVGDVDREMADQLILVRVGDSVPPEGVLLTTHLRPETATFSGRLELAQRLAGSLSSCLRRTETLQTQQDELHLTRELLELRCLVDTHFGSPVELLEEFLQRVCTATGFDRSTLHLASNERLDSKPLVRTGAPLARGIADLWNLDEAALARRGLQSTEPLHFDAAALHALQVRSTMCAALVAPLVHEETLIGVVTLSRQTDIPVSEVEQELLRWATDFLTETILKTIDRAIIEQQARRDALTQLANRHAFDQGIREQLERSVQTSEECSLILLDVDRFKSLNDRFGHLAGDEVLRNLARVIRATVASRQSSDRTLCARYGGEELAILLPCMGLQNAARVADAVVTAVREAETFHDGHMMKTTISAGVATCPLHSETPEGLIAAADAALYQAKQNGRNRTEVAAARQLSG
jgi:diguanylate cyclase (GGDEF)-like protein